MSVCDGVGWQVWRRDSEVVGIDGSVTEAGYVCCVPLIVTSWDFM